jgi:hypothetical protein
VLAQGVTESDLPSAFCFPSVLDTSSCWVFSSSDFLGFHEKVVLLEVLVCEGYFLAVVSCYQRKGTDG